MNIETIEITNFRLLKNFSINLEKDLSLVIGKNNTGKTSFLAILKKFLIHNSNTFSFDDFNIDLLKIIDDVVEDRKKIEDHPISISLRLLIKYNNNDNLENISNFLLDLSPSYNCIVLEFKYSLEKNSLNKLKTEYNEYKKDFPKREIVDFLKRSHKIYFKITKRAIEPNDQSEYKDIEDSQLKKIINFESIGAKRDVINNEGDSALSRLSAKYFRGTKSSNSNVLTELQKQLFKSDSDLNETYKRTFSEIINNVEKFSYNSRESKLQIKSTLEEINVLKDNTSVVYEQGGYLLPEDYNGLGYLNLFSMIFSIHIILNSFKKKNSDNDKPADINLLFIEEPEAHTHPQMQYVFIKNIKDLLASDGEELGSLQTIISTHSAHITSQSDFDDIKYFLRKDTNIIARNLKELQELYGTTSADKINFQFLKQYMTLNRAELFFADKVIMIEGDTERILVPVMMKKIDLENTLDETYTPLLSQNISIVEAGAYSHVFEKFIDFLNLKTLIITDIDSVNKDRKACDVSDGEYTSNASLKYFFGNDDLKTIVNYKITEKVFSKRTGKWQNNNEGFLRVAYQIEETNYYARSFEDSFISINYQFIKDNIRNFGSVKNIEIFNEAEPDYYEIAKKCIKKKSNFVSDILYFSDEKYSDWSIPQYIKEGLQWLVQ